MSDNWRDDAACLTEDPEIFFPRARIPFVRVEQVEKAKAVCARCKVAEMCLEYALANGEDSGVWGGLDEKERRKLKRKRAKA